MEPEFFIHLDLSNSPIPYGDYIYGNEILPGDIVYIRKDNETVPVVIGDMTPYTPYISSNIKPEKSMDLETFNKWAVVFVYRLKTKYQTLMTNINLI